MERAGKILRGVFMGVGAVVTTLIVAGLIAWGIVSFCMAEPGIGSGTVTAKRYDDGHIWYVDFRIGDLIIREERGGRERWLITVSDGTRTDDWEVSVEDYDRTRIGDSVTRSQFR